MRPITVEYTRDGDDWKVTVQASEKSLTGQAPGLIAARDRADQLVDKLEPERERRTVVHLLDGDAFAFTTAYLHARHGLTGSERVTGTTKTAATQADAAQADATQATAAKAAG